MAGAVAEGVPLVVGEVPLEVMVDEVVVLPTLSHSKIASAIAIVITESSVK